jgi:hypothetical protein
LHPLMRWQVSRIIGLTEPRRQWGNLLLAEDGGWPVKIPFDFSGDVDGAEVSFQLETNVTDVNPDIEIEAP